MTENEADAIVWPEVEPWYRWSLIGHLSLCGIALVLITAYLRVWIAMVPALVITVAWVLYLGVVVQEQRQMMLAWRNLYDDLVEVAMKETLNAANDSQSSDAVATSSE